MPYACNMYFMGTLNKIGPHWTRNNTQFSRIWSEFIDVILVVVLCPNVKNYKEIRDIFFYYSVRATGWTTGESWFEFRPCLLIISYIFWNWVPLPILQLLGLTPRLDTECTHKLSLLYTSFFRYFYPLICPLIRPQISDNKPVEWI
jgi:hypothetical protein